MLVVVLRPRPRFSVNFEDEGRGRSVEVFDYFVQSARQCFLLRAGWQDWTKVGPFVAPGWQFVGGFMGNEASFFRASVAAGN